MDDLKTWALRLLDRDPPDGPPVAPGVFRPGSLPDMLAALARPESLVDGPALASLCLAYAQAYVHPERLGDPLTLDLVTLLAGQFVLRRSGTPLLTGCPALRRFYLHHGFALQMLLDLPKTVHLLSVLLASPLPPEDRPFAGLDCGAGTGILLLGQYLLARRSGWTDWRLTGFEHLPQVAERANLLLSRLGVGRVLLADATRPEVYREYAQAPVACVTNETLPSAGRRLYKEPFPAISRAVFAALGPRLVGTRFLPEAVWASDRSGHDWLRLAPDNAFSGSPASDAAVGGKPLRLYFMRDVELAGQRMPVERVGEAYAGLVTPAWRAALGRRW